MKKPRPIFNKRDIVNIQISLIFVAIFFSLGFNVLNADDDINGRK